MTVVCTNRALNPRPAAATTGWAYVPGSGEAGTSTLVTGAVDGPVLADGTQVTSYMRRTVSTAKVSGASGWSYGGTAGAPAVGVAGDPWAGSMYVRSSVATSIDFRTSVRTGTTGAGSHDAGVVALPAGQWVRLSSLLAAAAGSYDNAYLWAFQSGITQPNGSTLDVCCAQPERGTVVHDYIDGALPDNLDYIYDWAGTANASISTQTLTAGIRVEAFTDAPCPRVGITVDGLGAGTSVVTVWRSSAGGKRRPVRGFRRRSVVGADFVVDFEVPLARLVTYELEVHSGAVVPPRVVDQVTIASTTGYVQDPLVPDTAVPVEELNAAAHPVLGVPSFRNLASGIGMSVTAILGSDEPVALAGQRLAYSGVDFTLLTDAAEASTALRTVLRTAFPVCIRPLPGWGPLPDVIYLAPPSIVEQPLGPALGGTFTRFVCAGDVVAPPSMSILVPIWSYADVEALWATYADAQAAATSAGATYLDVLKDPTMGGA